jgi:hypothetical protein
VTPVPRTLPVTLPDWPELTDHTIQGKATVPAALLLDLLVKAASGAGLSSASLEVPLIMRDAAFSRFLPADEIAHCTFEIALQDLATEGQPGAQRATLTSRISLAGGIHRTRTHAAVTLGGQATAGFLPQPTTDFEVSAKLAYQALIPFGPRYQNLHGELHFGCAGASALVCSPEPAFQEPSRAGCPYLFDSAMHLACLWGQRYAGVVAYPTGFCERVTPSPVAHGQRHCVVAPTSITPQKLMFDVWLTDDKHTVCDTVTGLAMTPLASGPKPPKWILHPSLGHHTP